jgi:hypothetical protein
MHIAISLNYEAQNWRCVGQRKDSTCEGGASDLPDDKGRAYLSVSGICRYLALSRVSNY